MLCDLIKMKKILLLLLIPRYYNDVQDDMVIDIPKRTQETDKEDSHLFENVVDFFKHNQI